MFRIGEFAQIAQVSGRLLRYYDELGLLHPVRVDPDTGYRYYSIRQLPQLNRILALKDLGLTLDQIGTFLQDEVSPDQLRVMLAMKRAQVEQSLRAEELRLRHIESRIAQIDEIGDIADYDVVVKAVPAVPYLSVRQHCRDMGEAWQVLSEVVDCGIRGIRPKQRDRLVVVARNDFEGEHLDLEFGFTLRRPAREAVALDIDRRLQPGELPAVDTMASIVRSGPPHESHRAFGAVGGWMESNGYAIAGPCREVFLEPITGPPAGDVLVEIQFPVRPAA